MYFKVVNIKMLTLQKFQFLCDVRTYCVFTYVCKYTRVGDLLARDW